MQLSTTAGAKNYFLLAAAPARLDSAHNSTWYDDEGVKYLEEVDLQADNFKRLQQVVQVEGFETALDPGCSIDASDCDLSFLSPPPGAAPVGPASVAENDQGNNADVSTSSPLEDLIPTRFGLAVTGQNPTKGMVRSRLDVPSGAEGTWEVAVFDVRGRRVRELVAGLIRPGRHHVAWDLRDDDGLRAAPGIYFMNAKGPGRSATRKVVVVR